MSYESIPTHSRAGESAPDHAVRDGVGGRWRRTSPKTRTEPVTPTNSPIAGEDPSPPATGRRPLRRWSVAELIARAVAAPTADRMSRC
jgi:hypothetical protein